MILSSQVSASTHSIEIGSQMTESTEVRPIAGGSVEAVKTWRYLRLAMFALVVGLAGAVTTERIQARCFQTSISAYYYTPAGVFFVGSLVAVGICLFCLKGSSDIEDLLLNIAGMCAPVVAFVPTTNRGSCTSASELADPIGSGSIFTSMIAYLVVGVVALLSFGVLSLPAVRSNRPDPEDMTKSGIFAFVISLALGFATYAIFSLARTWFNSNAHWIAAVLLFVCIFGAVVVNAIGYKREKTQSNVKNPYTFIGIAMLAVVVVTISLKFAGWEHWVLLIESGLILLFAAFWIIQSVDLWSQGLRSKPRRLG